MKNLLALFLLFLFAMTACNQQGKPSADQLDKWKDEILQTEEDFYQLSQDSGLAVAFEHYADTAGVIARRGKLLKGKSAIREFYEEGSQLPGSNLSWAPSFVHVADAGDLAYTYGKYVFTFTDTSGQTQSNEGYFQTIWKRQDDGSWRYVWD